MSKLIRDLGDSLAMFYAWQHGDGCMEKLPKEKELLQMPGRGPLDFKPLIAALATFSIPGGSRFSCIPCLEGSRFSKTPAQVTEEINRARKYIDGLL